MNISRRELCRGVNLNLIYTDKFKKDFLSVNFILPHKKEFAAYSSVLPDVMTRACMSYPNLRAIERELEECYGAQLSAYSVVKGESKIISFSMESLSDSYSFGDDVVFSRSFKLLSEVIFFPFVEDGALCREFVDSEKAKLIASVRRRRNSKRHYALDKCKGIMCEDEPFGIPSYGSEADIESVQADSLYSFYQFMINESTIEIFYVGNKDDDKISIISDAFSDIPRKEGGYQTYPSKKYVDKPKYTVEEADYKQSVLIMGFRTGVLACDRDKYAFSLFNSIFGAGVNSKLFKIVREKMHLCYYASCSPDMSKGVAFVSSGIDASNEEITKKAVLDQLDATMRGDFTDTDLEDCKKAIQNAYKELYDSPDNLCGWYLGRVIFGNFESAQNALENIMKVTADEVVEVAKKMQLDTVFMLKGVSKESVDISEDCQ